MTQGQHLERAGFGIHTIADRYARLEQRLLFGLASGIFDLESRPYKEGVGSVYVGHFFECTALTVWRPGSREGDATETIIDVTCGDIPPFVGYVTGERREYVEEELISSMKYTPEGQSGLRPRHLIGAILLAKRMQ